MGYDVGPFDREHGLLVWGGSLPGSETWSCSLRMAETEAGGFADTNDTAGWDMNALLAHYSTIIKAMHADAAAKISSSAKLNFVKFNRLDVNGHYIDNVSHIDSFTNISGGGSGYAFPNQVCLAVTLTTNISRGPASKGRFYLPMPQVGSDATTGLVSVADVNTIKTRMKTFIEALSDVPGLDTFNSPGVCVMSRKLGAPDTHRVNGIRIGRVLDTQRRRRRNLPESYELIAVDQGTF